ncbi:MAG: hypothetical protein AAB215_03480 [Planctomycetota bacterium]
MRPPVQPADLSRVKTIPAEKRPILVRAGGFGKPTPPGASFRRFYEDLPDFLGAKSLKAAARAIAAAWKGDRLVGAALGAHVIKVGLSPVVIDLMRRGILGCVSLHGAGAIHDAEVALFGETSEDVAAGLDDGSFGMSEETAEFFRKALKGGCPDGLGRALGKALLKQKAPNARLSILAQGARLGIPVTVHVAFGTDIVHMHPGIDAAALGEATMLDFRILAGALASLEGGVWMNVGSAVILPEVFLKALNVARNLGSRVRDFTALDLDMQRHYRPARNVLERPGGKAFALTGHHEITLPLLRMAVFEEAKRLG